MNEPNDKISPEPTAETEAAETASDEKNAPGETPERAAQDPDDEATVVEPPDPGFGPPAE